MNIYVKGALARVRGAMLPLLLAAVVAGCQTTFRAPELDAADASLPKRMVTQGRAKTIVENLTKCAFTHPKMNVRVAAVGEITATDGTVITMPAVTALQKGLGPMSYDLYNECNQVTPKNSAEVSTANVPVIDVDADGEVITGYIVADNYYEMYVNGKLVSVDNTPYTPFNSAIVKFRVKRPYTLAFLVVDWDEHLGMGQEVFPVPVVPTTNKYYPGDGGLIARFSDGTITDGSWKAQTFYIAPLMDPKEVVERGHVHGHAEPWRSHTSSRAQAAMRGQVLCSALSDSSQLAIASLQRLALAACLGVHRSGNRSDELARVYALSGTVRRSALDLVAEPGARQRCNRAQNGALNHDLGVQPRPCSRI